MDVAHRILLSTVCNYHMPTIFHVRTTTREQSVYVYSPGMPVALSALRWKWQYLGTYPGLTMEGRSLTVTHRTDYAV